MTNFKIIRSLNKGAFAHVYEVLEMVTGRTLALKIVRFNPPYLDLAKNGCNVWKRGQNHEKATQAQRTRYALIALINFVTGFPRIEAYGQVDSELGYIAMEILGSNSLDLMRKVEVKLRQ